MIQIIDQEKSILGRNVNFAVASYKSEAELEKAVAKYAKQLFGPSSLYLPVKHKLVTSYATWICDGLLLDLSDLFDPKFWIVEFELSTHHPFRSVEPQIMGFTKALKSEEVLSGILKVIYGELQRSSTLKKSIKRCLGESQDLYYVLGKVIHERLGILLIVDWITPAFEALVEDLSKVATIKVWSLSNIGCRMSFSSSVLRFCHQAI